MRNIKHLILLTFSFGIFIVSHSQALAKQLTVAKKIVGVKGQKTPSTQKVAAQTGASVANGTVNNNLADEDDDADDEEVEAVPDKITNMTQLDQSWPQHQLDKITQNQGNPRSINGWVNQYFGIGAMIAVDAQWQNSPFFADTKNVALSLGDAKLNFDINPFNWMSLHAGGFFSTKAENYDPIANTNHGIDVDEVYLNVASFKNTPFYVRLGKQYLPFGNYHRFKILKDLPMLLSSVRADAVQAGFITDYGFYGAGYGFEGKINDAFNYGALFGFSRITNFFGWDLGVGYINNILDAGTIYRALNTTDDDQTVHGISASLDLFAGPFDYEFRYVITTQPIDFTAVDNNSKTSSGSIGAGYNFNYKQRASRINFAYQWSRNAGWIRDTEFNSLIPAQRISITTSMEIYKNLIIAAQAARDLDYIVEKGGTGKADNIVTVRAIYLI